MTRRSRDAAGRIALVTALLIAGVLALPVVAVVGLAISKAEREPLTLPDPQGTEMFAARDAIDGHVGDGMGVADAAELLATLPDSAPHAARIRLGALHDDGHRASRAVLLVTSGPERYYLCETVEVARGEGGRASATTTTDVCPPELALLSPRGARMPPPHSLDG